MRFLSARTITVSVLVGGVAAGVTFAAVAAASIPDGGGVIHGCYNKSGGTLRVIDSDNPTKKCSSTQLPLNWNQQGAPGPAGPSGPAGADGVSGYQQVSAVFTNPANSQTVGRATCPSGTKVVGGGVFGSGGVTQSVNSSFPNGDGTWEVYVNNTASTASGFSVWAVCVVAH
jgi:hypothetical protein